MPNDPSDIPIAEQARKGPIFDVPKGPDGIRVVPLPEPPDDPPITPLHQASSQAGYLKLLTLLILLYVLCMSVVGSIASSPSSFVSARFKFGQWFLLIAVPTVAIRWWVSFGTVRSDDPDFRQAKRDTKIAVAIWIPFFFFYGIPAIQALLAPIIGFHRTT